MNNENEYSMGSRIYDNYLWKINLENWNENYFIFLDKLLLCGNSTVEYRKEVTLYL